MSQARILIDLNIKDTLRPFLRNLTTTPDFLRVDFQVLRDCFHHGLEYLLLLRVLTFLTSLSLARTEKSGSSDRPLDYQITSDPSLKRRHKV